MISLVTKAAAEAKSRNSKRVTAAHLKQAVQKNQQFDFLQDIVDKVADAPMHKGDGSDEDGDNGGEGKKRKSRAGGDGGGGAEGKSGRRRAKKESSDVF
jgi:hypothetical protein